MTEAVKQMRRAGPQPPRPYVPRPLAAATAGSIADFESVGRLWTRTTVVTEAGKQKADANECG
eukprot:12925416-Heterocapsa_arctica.AAC.1